MSVKSTVESSSLFGFSKFPALFPSLVQNAKGSLEQEPKSFKPLNQLAKYFQVPECDHAYFFPMAVKILGGDAFADLPGALNRLNPLAKRYVETLEKLETALEAESVETEAVKEALRFLAEAQTAFQDQMTVECQNASPAEPFTVMSRYPEALRLYFLAFVNQLLAIPKEVYAVWKSYAEEYGEEALALFPRLAIHHLLQRPNSKLPELFSAHALKIRDLQTAYELLDESQRGELLQALRFESEANDPQVHALWIQIGKLCSDLQRTDPRVFNGVARILYEEAAKAFALVEEIHLPEWPQDVEAQCRAVFLSLLKQDPLTADRLPRDFSGGHIEDETLAMHAKYQELSGAQKKQFDAQFLAKKMDGDRLFSDLEADWRRVYFHWAGGQIFPLHLLAKVAFVRANT